jgi:hypothetical protein
LADELLLVTLDRDTGTLLVEDETELGREVQRHLSGVLPAGDKMGCARPIEKRQLPAFDGSGVRIAGYWHGSQIEGPGVRSVVQFNGCPIRCKGCWLEEEVLDMQGGTNVAINVVADALLDPSEYRDGVTIIGGEPFAQPAALHSLVAELRGRNLGLHIAVYTGYVMEPLLERTLMPAPPPHEHVGADILGALTLIDMLIDGPYIRGLAHTDACQCSGEVRAYTGSCNQKVRRLR